MRRMLQEKRHLKNAVYLLTGSRSLDNPKLIEECADGAMHKTLGSNDSLAIYNRFIIYDKFFETLYGNSATQNCLQRAHKLASNLLVRGFCPISNTHYSILRLNRLLTGFMQRYEGRVLEQAVNANKVLAELNFPDDMIGEVLGFMLPPTMDHHITRMLY